MVTVEGVSGEDQQRTQSHCCAERHNSSGSWLGSPRRAVVLSIYTHCNPETHKNPSSITEPVGEQLEALISQYLRLFSLFPHASFSFLLTLCRHTKHPNISERYLQSQASKWPEFPCDLLTPSVSCRAFLGYVLTEIFLGLLWLKQSHSNACTWKVYICLECDSLWEQDTSYLAQGPGKHSLIWQHRGKHNTWLSCNNNFTFPLIPAFNQGNCSVGCHLS